MLLALLPVHFVPVQPVALLGGAGFVKESGKALKEIEQGEFNMVTTGEDGTSTVRMLANKTGARITIITEKEVTTDFALQDGKYVVVDHSNRTVSLGGFKDVEGAASTPTAIAENSLNLSFDTNEGIVFRSNPEMENVRRWTDGKNELFTGDFGKGKNQKGSFQWERDAQTKLPKRFSGTIDGRPIEVVFKIKARTVSPDEIAIPTASYKGYTVTSATVTKSGG